MNPIEAAVFGCLGFGVLYWMYYEYQRYATQDSDESNPLPYSQKRFRRRTLVSLLFLLILALLAFREQLTPLLPNKLLLLLYYSIPLLMVCYIVLLALADLLETSKQIREARDGLTRESAERISLEILKSAKYQEHLKKEQAKKSKTEAKQ